jgi:putative transposase
LVFHVLNRAVARLALFEKNADYEVFERVMAEALVQHPTRALAHCVMPNHWHLVVWPRKRWRTY